MICIMWIERQFEELLRKSAETRPVVVLTGPRQTGKTSIISRVANPFPLKDGTEALPLLEVADFLAQ